MLRCVLKQDVHLYPNTRRYRELTNSHPNHHPFFLLLLFFGSDLSAFLAEHHTCRFKKQDAFCQAMFLGQSRPSRCLPFSHFSPLHATVVTTTVPPPGHTYHCWAWLVPTVTWRAGRRFPFRRAAELENLTVPMLKEKLPRGKISGNFLMWKLPCSV